MYKGLSKRDRHSEKAKVQVNCLDEKKIVNRYIFGCVDNDIECKYFMISSFMIP